MQNFEDAAYREFAEVLGERVACDRDERLRVSSRRVTEPGRLPAGEDDRLH